LTAQIPDTFIYKGEEYSIVGESGDGLINPREFKLELMMASTACWRGYLLTYELKDNQLLLKKLLCRLKEKIAIQEIQPKTPGKDESYMFNTKYDLNLPVKFTGSFLIARDFIREMYVHMGFPRPMAFRDVYRLEFEDGKLTLEKDLSEQMKEQRENDIMKDAQPNSPSEVDVSEWINKTFSLDHEKKD